MLSLIRKETVHGVKIKKVHIGRLKGQIIGRLNTGSLSKSRQENKAVSQRQTQKQNTLIVRKETKMANEHTNSNEYVAQAVAKAARVPIQSMSAAGVTRTEKVGPRMSRPIMKQPTFDQTCSKTLI